MFTGHTSKSTEFHLSAHGGKEDFSSDRTSAKLSDAVVCMTNQDKRVDCYIIQLLL